MGRNLPLSHRQYVNATRATEHPVLDAMVGTVVSFFGIKCHDCKEEAVSDCDATHPLGT
jgi:hypothetical protein